MCCLTLLIYDGTCLGLQLQAWLGTLDLGEFGL
jgi:hypothetical protein